MFRVLEEAGHVTRDEMYRVFNMGVGMIVIADERGARRVCESAVSNGIRAFTMGTVVRGSGAVRMDG